MSLVVPTNPVTVQGRIVIAVGLALGLAIAGYIVAKHTRAHSTDKRVKIYDVRYFPGTNFDYRFVPIADLPKYECQRLLDKLGIQPLPWRRYRPVKLSGPGPAFIIYGDIELEDAEKNWLELVADNGESLHQNSLNAIKLSEETATAFIWSNRLTNHIYHLRLLGQSRDLAVVHVR